jgi:hypothetical protein
VDVILGQGHVPWMRTFKSDGTFPRKETSAVTPIANTEPTAPGARGGNADIQCKTPMVVALGNGTYPLVWTKGGRIQFANFDRDGARLADPIDLNAAGPKAEPGQLIAIGAGGEFACLWNSKDGERMSVRASGAAAQGAAGFTTVACGAGSAQGLEADPKGGFWALFLVDEKPVLRHLGADGKSDRADVAVSATSATAAQLAVLDAGVAVLTESAPAKAPEEKKPGRGERAERARAAAAPPLAAGGLQLALFDAAGKPDAAGPMAVPSAAAKDVQNARVASNGRVLFVAWTDMRGTDPDVYGRLVDPSAAPDARLGAERRLNTDVASSDQITASIASNGGLGVTAWVDKRSGTTRAYLRRVTPTGFEGDEIALPATPRGAEAIPVGGGAIRPEAAVRPNGDFLVAWKQVNDAQSRIVGQIFDKDGSAKSGLLAIDEGGPTGDVGELSLTTLAGDRGYLVAWSRSAKNAGVWSRRVHSDGKFSGAARRVSEPNEEMEGYVNVATLDDGRVLCAWTRFVEGQSWNLRARFVDEAGEGRGDELAFDHSRRNNDWDPAIAPGDNGGFMLSWTSGPPTDGGRDVVVRSFDREGHARGPILTVCFLANEQDFSDITRLADKSFAVAWEDDVSYYDQVYVRRIARDGKSMGPWMRINQIETKYMPDRVAPRIAALGDGWAASFGDRRRALGFDVRVKVVGPRWDSPAKDAAAPGK